VPCIVQMFRRGTIERSGLHGHIDAPNFFLQEPRPMMLKIILTSGCAK